MLDLAFVLLIIFMITTPLMENSVDLVIPSSEAAKYARGRLALPEMLAQFESEATSVEDTPNN